MLKKFLLALIGFYKAAISPVVSGGCKFYPTCSEYAADAIRKYGPAKGAWMAAARVVRCRPFRPGGYDPVC